ncbi:MAG: hypothetical protein JWO76_3109 [Nocardioides sp.]|nr:hypothetical protein [Nocardioides sp.]
MELYTDVAAQYADFATYARADSPCFEEWADGVAADPEVLAWIAGLPPVKQQPNLVFAAARWHGVPAPAPYDALRAALLGDDGAIRTTILERATQTNEVGRLATLVPALALVAEGRPVSLLEVGASAGLCLYPDRHAYAWTTEGGVRSAGRGPVLACEVEGPAPLPERPPAVAWRGGIDLNPLDVTDDDAMAWLTMLVWPEHDDRRARLVDAIAVAGSDPPELVRGDLLEELPSLVARASEHGPVVVFHSAVIAYLEDDDRRRFSAMMHDLVAAGRCRWVSNEGRRVLPDVTATGPGEVPSGRFVLGIDGRAVAWTHGHGRSMTWLG